MNQTSYSLTKEVDYDFSVALEKTKEALKLHGFGILTTIDAKAKMKEKLNKDMDEYMILGACNPPLAYEAIQAEIEIGLLLPCNVIVYQKNGKVNVAAIRPSQAMNMVENASLPSLANDVEKRLKSVIESI